MSNTQCFIKQKTALRDLLMRTVLLRSVPVSPREARILTCRRSQCHLMVSSQDMVLLQNNPVYVYSQDASALNGTIGEMHARKIAHIYELAMKTGVPVIGLIDCAGMRLQEATDALAGFGQIYQMKAKASSVVPQISAIFGNCGGGVAVMAAMSDFTFMEQKEAKLFVNSPNTLEGNYTDKLDTASADFQKTASTVDFVIEGEAEVLAAVRELVSILPENNNSEAGSAECMDDLNRDVPDFAAEAADPAAALADLGDNNFFLR